MERAKNTYMCAVIWWTLVCLRKSAFIEFHGLQPDNVTNLNDSLIATCSRFEADKHQHTQIFKEVNCSIGRMSVTLVGQHMRCIDNVYVVGLTGSDVGRRINSWKRCRPSWQTGTDDNADWCHYDCTCAGGCEQTMVLRWPKMLTDRSWTLCDISYYCTGYCSNQSVCYIFGEGSWDEGIQSCQRLHPNARMIEEKSEEQGIRHTAEAVRAGYVSYWIGGRRPPNGDVTEFYWNSSLLRLTYTRWREGQPYRGAYDADCIQAIGESGWRWDDSVCSTLSMYMCKVAANL